LERAAVAQHVRAEYDKRICQQPTSYVAKNAQSDPDGWQDRLCELIATEEKRVRAILDYAERKAIDKAGGFTLIEMSIVLVIIGLIVGGILVGQSLISAATARAQITQIEQFNTAANTFFGKYGYLPGDIPAGPATQFGFASRGSYAGEGDGNGVVEGITANAASSQSGFAEGTGETVLFWADLSQVNLIAGSFTNASATNVVTYPINPTPACGHCLSIPELLPQAKIQSSAYVYVYEASTESADPSVWSGMGVNYFGVSVARGIDPINGNTLASYPAFTVQQAYAVDQKIDDGFPQSGNVIAVYLSSDPAWSNAPTGPFATTLTPITTATTGSATTCYDNGGVAGTQQYSVEQNGGANINCRLSFKLQTGN
jgi:prepilin-type N-terminal cleavage/methylation domain-containing protein